MGRPTKLKQTVLLTDPESGEPLTLLAGSKPGARLAKLITNPAAWSDEDVEDDERGTVEQSGPYAGMTFDQLAAVARSRDLQVADDATTDEVLDLVVADDGVRAEALAKVAQYEADLAAKADADAKKAAAEAETAKKAAAKAGGAS